MSDQYEEQAADLVPCMMPQSCYGHGHLSDCPAHYRPAVAAALRELGEQNRNNVIAKDAEIAALRQQLAAVQEGVSSFLRHCPGLDEIACVRAVTEFHKWLAAQADEEKADG